MQRKHSIKMKTNISRQPRIEFVTSSLALRKVLQSYPSKRKIIPDRNTEKWEEMWEAMETLNVWVNKISINFVNIINIISQNNNILWHHFIKINKHKLIVAFCIFTSNVWEFQLLHISIRTFMIYVFLILAI